MPPKTVCACAKHNEWHHSEPRDMRVASFYELKFCTPDSKHGKRKRKICIACRSRITVEEKCRKLTAEEESDGQGDCNLDSELASSHVEFDIGCDTEQQIPMGISDRQEECNLDIHEHAASPAEVGAGCDTEPQIPVIRTELDHADNNMASASKLSTCMSKRTQVPSLPMRPYQEAQDRTKRDMRAEIIETIKSVALKYVHFEPGPPLLKLMEDILQSRNWKQTFGSLQQSTIHANEFLQVLAREYKDCKDKESRKQVQENSKGQKQKLLIGNTKANSKIAMFGDTPLDASSRVEAAKKIGRICHYGDEKRRLLSIVASDYPYSLLQNLFQCSPNTITAARVHAILFGRGGVPPSNFKFKRQRVSPEVLEELTEFLNRDDIARASSCRGVLVDGNETAVRYWQDSLKNVVQQYLLENPNGVKRTYIYTHLPGNFRMNTMLAGLCNLCDDFGHTNFDAICELVPEIANLGGGEANSIDPSSLVKEIRDYQTFLKRKYSKLVERHSTCLELCMAHAFGTCSQEHSDSLQEMTKFYDACDRLSTSLQNLPNAAASEKLDQKLKETISTHWSYVSHLMRTKHQADYYKYVLKNLKPGECVVVVDYKMKLELGQRTRENQRDWYGKRGISLHGFYVTAQVLPDQRSAEVIDLWSEDTKQDTWFSQSALDVGFHWLETAFPGFKVYLFSDNGPHYHNTGFLVYLAEVNRAFDLTLVDYNYFEAGEGKTVLDTHFAHISHKIVRWVRVGNNLETGEQLSNLVSSIKSTSCFKLLINREKAPKKMGTLKDISLLGSFSFPLEGNYAGGLVARSLAGVGTEVTKTKSQLQSLSGREIPLAGATGARIEQDSTPETRAMAQPREPPATYSIQFIQHAPEPLISPNKSREENYVHSDKQPPQGFALKKAGGKRAAFTMAQKEVMIEFYDRQATQGIRANPKDVIEVMRQRGIEPLKEVQITRWWSSYHQKRKNAINNLGEEVNIISNTRNQQNLAEQQNTPDEPVREQLPSYNNSSPQQTSGGQQQATCNVQCDIQPTSQQSIEHSQPDLQGSSSIHTPDTLEWQFPVDLSQSTIDGRQGSNACTFIALFFGHLYFSKCLGPPVNSQLQYKWKLALTEAIISGNEIHDDIFEGDATNVAVDEAIEIAGDECFVNKIDQQFDIIGGDRIAQLKVVFQRLAISKPHSCHVIVSGGRSMLLIINHDGSSMIVDSHQHKATGAIIAYTSTGNAESLAQWFARMHYASWDTNIGPTSIVSICYHS